MSASPGKLLACQALVWLVLSCCMSSAFAHAMLISVEPADGAVVAEAPTRIVLTFNEPVSPLVMTLVTSEGQQHDLLAATKGGSEQAVVLPEGLKDGTSILSWRVVSGDGHPIGGATSFSIGIMKGEMATAVSQGDPVVSAAVWASRLVLYAALFFGVGSAVFGALIAPLPPLAARLASAVIAAGSVAVPLSHGLQGIEALGLGPADLFGSRAWKVGLSTSYAWTLGGCVIALVLAGISLYRRSSALFAVGAMVAGALALAASGHAAGAGPPWVTRLALFLHIAGIMFWIGALLPLFILLTRVSQESSLPLARFSAAIPYPVAAIVLSGIVLGAFQLGPQPEFWWSAYGAIFLGKLCLLFVLFGLAAWNRFGLTRAVLDDDATAGRHLRRSIRIEMSLVLAILALVAGWRFTPPPRAMAEIAAELPVDFRLQVGSATAEIIVTPGRAGTNMLAVRVTDDDGASVTPLAISIALSSPEAGIGPMRKTADAGSNGLWNVSGVPLPLAGRWQIDLEIRLSRFELVAATSSFTIR